MKKYVFSKARYEDWLRDNDLGNADWEPWADECHGKVVENFNAAGVGHIGKYDIDIDWCREVDTDD